MGSPVSLDPEKKGIVASTQKTDTPQIGTDRPIEPDHTSISRTSTLSKAASTEQHDGDIEKQQPQSDTQSIDPNIVDWDGPDDIENPMNWPERKKWLNIGVISGITFLTPLASSMFAPGVPRLIQDFHEDSDTIATFVVSVYVLGYAVGPLLVAPISELYGRLWVYHICNVGFIAFTVGCALATNINMLIGFRFLAGCFGVSALTLGGGTIADCMPPQKRGGAMAIWAMGPLMGPVVGPIAGGFLSAAKGWRWIFWVIAIVMGAVALVALCVMKESYPPVLLERKAERLRKETGNSNLRSKLDQGISPREVFIRSVVRPAKLMFLSPICALMSLYMAIVYGILYLLFTTFTFVFEGSYGFSESIIGLVYIGIGIGLFIGLFLLGIGSDRISKYLAEKHSNGVMKPEYRLPPLMFGAPFIPVGLFIYGWTAQYEVQWAVPLLGTLFVGIGLIAAFMCINTYLIDTFTLYAASAMAANTILRSVFGAVFPLFALKMYNALGLGWGNSLIAFIALALCPVPFLFYSMGERIRTRFAVKL